jgi:hypothetical protein
LVLGDICREAPHCSSLCGQSSNPCPNKPPPTTTTDPAADDDPRHLRRADRSGRGPGQGAVDGREQPRHLVGQDGGGDGAHAHGRAEQGARAGKEGGREEEGRRRRRRRRRRKRRRRRTLVCSCARVVVLCVMGDATLRSARWGSMGSMGIGRWIDVCISSNPLSTFSQATLPLTEGREETPADKKQERKFGF